jgi:hypothetical protein
MATHDIFISYRRDDSIDTAATLQRSLEGAGWNVFRDEGDIHAGHRWHQSLEAALEACQVVIVLIGPAWLCARLLEPDDPVRCEIRTALALNKKLVPVLIRNAVMPKPESLPDDIAELTRWQAHPLPPNGLSSSIAALIRQLQRLLPSGDTPEEVTNWRLIAGLRGIAEGALSDILSALRLHLASTNTNDSFANKATAIAGCERWLDSTENFCLVISEQAQGKSYLCTSWAAQLMQREGHEIIFIPQSASRSERDVAAVILARLGHITDEHPDVISEDCSLPRAAARDRILLRLRQAATRARIVILFDGIDDAEEQKFSLRDLGLTGRLPQQVRVCAFARRLADRGPDDWRDSIGWPPSTAIVRIEPLRPDQIDAYADSITPLKDHPDAERLKERLRDCVCGSSLLLRFWIEHILKVLAADGTIDLARIDNRDSDLRRRIKSFIQYQKEDWPDPPLMDEMLVVFAYAGGPVELSALCQLLPDNPQPFRVERAVAAMDRLVCGGQREGYSVSHPLLLEEIREGMRPEDEPRLHRRVVEYGERLVRARINGEDISVPPFIARFLPVHLEKAQARGEWIMSLTDPRWVDAIRGAAASASAKVIEPHCSAALAEFRALLLASPQRLPELLPAQIRAILFKASCMPSPDFAQLASGVLSALERAGPSLQFSAEKGTWSLQLAIPGLSRHFAPIALGLALVQESASARARALALFAAHCDKEVARSLSWHDFALVAGSAGRCDHIYAAIYDAAADATALAEGFRARLLATQHGIAGDFVHLARAPLETSEAASVEAQIIEMLADGSDAARRPDTIAIACGVEEPVRRDRLLRLIAALDRSLRCEAIASISSAWVRTQALWSHWQDLTDDECEALIGGLPAQDNPHIADWCTGLRAALLVRRGQPAISEAELLRMSDARVRRYILSRILLRFADHREHGKLCQFAWRQLSCDDELHLAMLSWSWNSALGQGDEARAIPRKAVAFSACTIEERYALVTSASPGADAAECEMLLSIAQTIDDDRLFDTAVAACGVRFAHLGDTDRAMSVLNAVDEPLALLMGVADLSTVPGPQLPEELLTRCRKAVEQVLSLPLRAQACALMSRFDVAHADEWTQRAVSLLRAASDVEPLFDDIAELPADDVGLLAGQLISRVNRKGKLLRARSIRAEYAMRIAELLPCPEHGGFVPLVAELAHERKDAFWQIHGLIFQADHLQGRERTATIARAAQILREHINDPGFESAGLTCHSRMIVHTRGTPNLARLIEHLTIKLLETSELDHDTERGLKAVVQILLAVPEKDRAQIWSRLADLLACRARQQLYPLLLALSDFFEKVENGKDLRPAVLREFAAARSRWP